MNNHTQTAYNLGAQAAMEKFSSGPLSLSARDLAALRGHLVENLPRNNWRGLVPSAAVGAGVGLGHYALDDDKDKSLLLNLAGGAALGAGAGHIGRSAMRAHLLEHPEKGLTWLGHHEQLMSDKGPGGKAYRWMNPVRPKPDLGHLAQDEFGHIPNAYWHPGMSHINKRGPDWAGRAYEDTLREVTNAVDSPSLAALRGHRV